VNLTGRTGMGAVDTSLDRTGLGGTGSTFGFGGFGFAGGAKGSFTKLTFTKRGIGLAATVWNLADEVKPTMHTTSTCTISDITSA
jgi:hypothetical protein